MTNQNLVTRIEQAVREARDTTSVVHIKTQPGTETFNAIRAIAIAPQEYYVVDRSDESYMDLELFDALHVIATQDNPHNDTVLIIVSQVGGLYQSEEHIEALNHRMRSILPVIEVENMETTD